LPRRYSGRPHANLPDGTFPTLRFFCNWVAHIKLTRGEGAEVVKAMNDIFAVRLQGQRMNEDNRQALSSLFGFDTFRAQLLEFLRDNDLTGTVLELLPEWIAFTKHYASVVADCPIIYSKKDVSLKWMDRVVISTCEVDPAMLEYYRAEDPCLEAPFGMRWSFFKGHRAVMKWEVPMILGSTGGFSHDMPGKVGNEGF
jgi:hypothetical protein